MRPLRILPALLALAAAAACGPSEHALPEESAPGATPPDTAAAPAGNPQVEAARRRIEEARAAEEARRREALEAAERP